MRGALFGSQQALCHQTRSRATAARWRARRRAESIKIRVPLAIYFVPCCTSWHSLPEFSAARQSSQQRRTGSQRQHRQHTHAKAKKGKQTRRVRGKCVRRRWEGRPPSSALFAARHALGQCRPKVTHGFCHSQGGTVCPAAACVLAHLDISVLQDLAEARAHAAWCQGLGLVLKSLIGVCVDGGPCQHSAHTHTARETGLAEGGEAAARLRGAEAAPRFVLVRTSGSGWLPTPPHPRVLKC